MKKTLFVLALGLTIVTSMVAGTMAIYTHTDQILAANGNETLNGIAKKFYINAETTTVDLNDFKLAPGETANWDFKVTNVDKKGIPSEVDTDLIVAVNLKEISDWVDFDVVMKGPDGKDIEKVKEGNKISFIVNKAMKGGSEINEGYTLEFTWLDEGVGTLKDEEDTALVMDKDKEEIKGTLPHVTGISVTVTGNQSKPI